MVISSLLGAFLPAVGKLIGSGLKHLFSDTTKNVVGKVSDFAANYGLYRAANSSLTGAQREANAFTEQQNQNAMAFEEKMADKQMAFQADQAATQWQRGVSDMQAAGLNPALAYGQGGASAMTGSSGSGFTGASVSPVDNMSSLLQLALLDEQRKNIQAHTKLTEAQAVGAEKQNNWIDSMNRATTRQLNAAADLAISDKNLNENERKALLAVQKVFTENQNENLTYEMAYNQWRAEYIKATGTSPETKNLEKLFTISLKGMYEAWSDLFSSGFRLGYGYNKPLENPFARPYEIGGSR